MLKPLISPIVAHFPSRLFCLSNLLFWLVLNTIAADHTHRSREYFERSSNFYLIWLEYLPWWVNWAIVAPFVIAAIHSIRIDQESVARIIAKNLVIMAVAMLVYWGMSVVEAAALYAHGDLSWEVLHGTFERLLVTPMHFDVLVYIAIASLGFAMQYYAHSKQQAVNNQKLANQLLKAELQTLKSQLSPHFLFNTLNTISGLVRMDHKDAAVNALSELSNMFRTVLENQKQQLTSLGDEMKFINSYLTIQKMRFENKLAVQLDVSPSSLESDIPFMLLHTLVENAVQHGSQLESDENILKLHIREQDDWLVIKLTNRVCRSGQHRGFGIGLENCRKRLRHIYGSRYALECQESEEGIFETYLKLPREGAYA